MGFGHTCVAGFEEPARGRVLPGPRQVATQLDRWTMGTMRYGVRERNLPDYLDEFMFRFDHRTATSRGLLFFRLVEQAANGRGRPGERPPRPVSAEPAARVPSGPQRISPGSVCGSVTTARARSTSLRLLLRA